MAICCPAVVVLSCDWNACKNYPIQEVIIPGDYVFTVNSPTPQTLTYFFGLDESIAVGKHSPLIYVAIFRCCFLCRLMDRRKKRL